MIGNQICPKCMSLIKEEWFVDIGLPVEDALAYGEVSFHCPYCKTLLDVDVIISIGLKIHSSASEATE